MEKFEAQIGEVVVISARIDHEGDLSQLCNHLRTMETHPGMRLVIQFSGKKSRIDARCVGAAMIAVARLVPLDGEVVVVCDNPQIGLLLPCRNTPAMYKSLKEALASLAPTDDGV